MDDEGPFTATETKLEEKERCTTLLQKQLSQFQQEVELANRSPPEQAQAAAIDGEAQGAVTHKGPSETDIRLDFHAGLSMLPAARAPANNREKELLTKLSTLFSGASTFAGVPVCLFQQLGVPPSLVHTLVGDQMWEVSGKQTWGFHIAALVPQKQMNIPRPVMHDHLKNQPLLLKLDEGICRYKAAQENATKAKR